MIHDFRVLGTTEDLPRLVKELKIGQVVITIARITRGDIVRIIDICHKIPVKLRIIPGLYEILQGKVQVSRIRNVQIEDLLGREPVELDEKQVGHFLAGKRSWSPARAGRSARELARQVARFKPEQLLLVDRAEFALFAIDRNCGVRFPTSRSSLWSRTSAKSRGCARCSGRIGRRSFCMPPRTSTCR